MLELSLEWIFQLKILRIKIKQQEGIINFVYRQNIVDDALLRDQVWDYYVKKIIMENEFNKIGLDISDEEWVLKIKDQNNTHEILKLFLLILLESIMEN